jgi:hypothetical protein
MVPRFFSKRRFKIAIFLSPSLLLFLLFQNFASMDIHVITGQKDLAARIFPDIQTALDYVRDNGAAITNANILIHHGRYNLVSPLRIDIPGLANNQMTLTLSNYENDSVVISGSQQTISKDWKSAGTAMPGACVVSGLNYPDGFSSLFASDGIPRVRSRHPNLPYFYQIEGPPDSGISPEKGFKFASGIGSAWDFSEVEVVGLQMYRAPRLRIKLILAADAAGIKTVEFENPASETFDMKAFSERVVVDGYKYRFYTENVPKVDAPGEWYFKKSSGEMFYYPQADESCATGNLIKTVNGVSSALYLYIPAFSSAPLLEIGSSTSIQQNIKIQGLVFAHTDWRLPAKGYGGAQALSPPNQDDYFLYPAIQAYCTHCEFSNNSFSQLGGHGLHLYGARNLIKLNRFNYVGGHAIMLGDRFENHQYPLTEANRIWDNIIENIGGPHNESVGIISYFSGGHEIAHNRFSNISFSAISMGWDWSSQYTLAGNNKISANLIENTLLQLNDNGAIYIVGNHPGSVIEGNYISNPKALAHQVPYVSSQIYFDRGTTGWMIQNNFVLSAKVGSVKMRRSYDNTFTNNYFVGLADQTSSFFLARETFKEQTPLGINNVITKNIFYRPQATSNTLWMEKYGDPISTSTGNLYFSSFTGDPANLSAVWGSNLEIGSFINKDPLLSYQIGDPASVNLQLGSPAFDLGIQKIGFGGVGPRYSTVGAK